MGPDNKSVSKIVELGDEVGSYYVVKSGLTKDDNVVVEGLTNLKEGRALNPAERMRRNWGCPDDKHDAVLCRYLPAVIKEAGYV